jgi:hypothetical protein
VIDLLPPGKFDPTGMHGAIWDRLGGRYDPPAGESLTLVSYRAAGPVTAYIEPLSVGRELPTMPLFLDPEHYVHAPLESTYREAYAGLPRRWQRVIESQPKL